MKNWKVIFSNPSLSQFDEVIASFKTEPEANDFINDIPYHKGRYYKVEYQA